MGRKRGKMNTEQQIVEYFESNPELMDLKVPNWPVITKKGAKR